jgi:hypothetical protein
MQGALIAYVQVSLHKMRSVYALSLLVPLGCFKLSMAEFVLVSASRIISINYI